MSERVASCRCGQLRASCVGDPERISVCHCLDCQKRSGSSFAAQARWPDESVTWAGDYRTWTAPAEPGKRATFRFCPICGSTIGYQAEGLPGLTAIAVGAFADPAFPPPVYSVYEERKHGWVSIIGEGIAHYE